MRVFGRGEKRRIESLAQGKCRNLLSLQTFTEKFGFSNGVIHERNIPFFIAKDICDNLSSVMQNIEIKSIGKLTTHPDIEEWLISELISIPFFDGKELKFTICGIEDNNNNLLMRVDQAIQNFLVKSSVDRTKYTPLIYKNYQDIYDFYKSINFDITSLDLNNPEEIWQYVYPYSIYLGRESEENEDFYLFVYCNCSWEEEHGLQLVFTNGLDLTKVSGVDGSPTE